MTSTSNEPSGRTLIGCAALFIAAVALFLLEVTENGARINTEIMGRLGSVAVVSRQHLVDVLALKLFFRLG